VAVNIVDKRQFLSFIFYYQLYSNSELWLHMPSRLCALVYDKNHFFKTANNSADFCAENEILQYRYLLLASLVTKLDVFSYWFVEAGHFLWTDYNGFSCVVFMCK